jgi:glycosyltransferase involved in cell wall biosynthesis
LWAARLCRKKFVVKIVGDYAWEQGVQRFGITDTLDAFVRRAHVPFGVSLLRAVQTHVAHSATKIIVPSNYLKGIVSAWGIDPQKIEVIYNAITLEEEGQVPTAVENAGRPRIVTIGRLVPWKRINGVISAIAKACTGTLVVVGDGPEREKLEEQVKELQSSGVIFTGALAHKDALAVLADADVFVLNSTYEGLSHVLIEALMLGKPVIATDAGGNGELIENEKNGVLIRPDSPEALTTALKKVFEDSGFAKRIAAEALTARGKFSTAAMRARTADVLSHL